MMDNADIDLQIKQIFDETVVESITPGPPMSLLKYLENIYKVYYVPLHSVTGATSAGLNVGDFTPDKTVDATGPARNIIGTHNFIRATAIQVGHEPVSGGTILNIEVIIDIFLKIDDGSVNNIHKISTLLNNHFTTAMKGNLAFRGSTINPETETESLGSGNKTVNYARYIYEVECVYIK